jgi:hypothetical protein
LEVNYVCNKLVLFIHLIFLQFAGHHLRPPSEHLHLPLQAVESSEDSAKEEVKLGDLG